MPDVEYYNYATSGAGNQYISYKIVESNHIYKFTDTDLILVMYSTYCREDRYLEDHWETPGNIYTCGFYNEEFTKKYSCPKGYLLRDISIMDMTHNYLKQLPGDSIELLSVPWEYQTFDFDLLNVVGTFRKVHDRFNQGTLHELVGRPEPGSNAWTCGHWYHWDVHDPKNEGKLFGDYHPNTVMYYQYLKKLSFKLNDYAEQYSNEVTEKLNQCKTRQELELTAIPYKHERKHSYSL
jgi:hypothetical protein